MKRILMLPFILIFCFTSVVHAQIQNTQWKGTLIMDSTVDIVWHFDKDTSRVFTQADSSILETMIYKTEGGFLFLTRVSGISSCEKAIGKYKFDIRDEKLYLKPVADACQDRADAISSEPYVRIK
jgi:hypothetical protein